MHKLGFKEEEETKFKLTTSLDYGESKGVPEKHLLH